MPPDRETIARNLRTARENRGLSQHAVAKKLGLSRTLVAMVELGNRPVTDEELLQFARLYGRTLVELKGIQMSEDEDPVTTVMLKLAPELAAEEMQHGIHGVLGSLMEAAHLQRLLERGLRNGPPRYCVPAPRTLADALGQGEQIGERERERFGLRERPIGDMAALMSTQGIHVFTLDLPDRISGLFIQHSSIGSAMVVNAKLDAARQRLAIAHGYAHAIIEPVGMVRVCMLANAQELIERRADAFAGAFLMPALGLDETVHWIGKGQPSRHVQWVFDAATERAVRTEERSIPGSQVMTYLDVAWIASRFGAAYRLTVSRLLGVGVISETDSTRLLRPKLVELAGEWLALFREAVGVQSPYAVCVLSDLNAERAYLAAEAYRRGLITKSDLTEEASSLSLQVPGLTEPKLLEFAEAAR
jgi:transcriptional regulator with XRE-family HTH domain